MREFSDHIKHLDRLERDTKDEEVTKECFCCRASKPSSDIDEFDTTGYQACNECKVEHRMLIQEEIVEQFKTERENIQWTKINMFLNKFV
jgi:hypothetical protein